MLAKHPCLTKCLEHMASYCDTNAVEPFTVLAELLCMSSPSAQPCLQPSQWPVASKLPLPLIHITDCEQRYSEGKSQLLEAIVWTCQRQRTAGLQHGFTSGKKVQSRHEPLQKGKDNKCRSAVSKLHLCTNYYHNSRQIVKWMVLFRLNKTTSEATFWNVAKNKNFSLFQWQ